MSIQRVSCPGCGASLNVPAAMANVRCPHCSAVFNPNQPRAAVRPVTATPATGSDAPSGSRTKTAVVAGAIAGTILLVSLLGLMVALMPTRNEPEVTPAAPQATSETAAVETAASETATVAAAAPTYREVALPESTRRAIYDDYRKAARSSTEQPLLLPDGTRVRARVEDMLQKTLDREVSHFAALHDISTDDVRQIIAEGDAKQWDPTPRSNATRGGERLYPKEMSEGWERK